MRDGAWPGDRIPLRNAVVGLGLAAAIFFLNYAEGGFFPSTRAYAGIAVWWLIGVAAAVGFGASWSRLSRFAVAAPAFLALFAVWALISSAWAPDAERAFQQFDQVSLYVAVLVMGIFLARLVAASVLVGATAFAISVVAVIALVSRVFPSTFGPQAGGTILPDLNVRLSFPLGYWNGLGVLVALAYPLLLASMTSRRSRLASALAAFPLPVLASDMYLASSRGAFLAAAVGCTLFVLLSPHRWTALAGAVFAGIAGASAIEVLHSRTALVTGETSALGISQGHFAALVIGIACVLAALVWLGLSELGRRLSSPPRVAGWAVAGLIVVIVIAGVVAAHPIRRFHAFQGNASYVGNQTYVTKHLLSSSGGGHWQFWGVAMREFRAHPLAGGGAGSWEYWWQKYGPLQLYSEFAHSLYLETMAELGIIGLLLLAAAILVAFSGSVRSALLTRSGEIAAAAACGGAFFVSAAFEWVWQLAGVTVVGLGMLGVALGALPATRARTWDRFGVARPLLALVAVAAIVPQIVVLSATIHLNNSQSAADAGNTARARSEALAAKAVEPWAESPYLQLAKISAAEGRLDEARRWVVKAIDRSRYDFNAWILAAHIDASRGKIALWHRDFTEVCAHYPLEAYFCRRSS